MVGSSSLITDTASTSTLMKYRQSVCMSVVLYIIWWSAVVELMRASYSVVRSVVRGKISSSSCGRPSIDGGAVVVLAV